MILQIGSHLDFLLIYPLNRRYLKLYALNIVGQLTVSFFWGGLFFTVRCMLQVKFDFRFFFYLGWFRFRFCIFLHYYKKLRQKLRYVSQWLKELSPFELVTATCNYTVTDVDVMPPSQFPLSSWARRCWTLRINLGLIKINLRSNFTCIMYTVACKT